MEVKLSRLTLISSAKVQTHKSGIEVVRRRCLNSIPFTICLPCMSGLSVFLSSGGSYFTWQAKVIYPKYYKKLKWTLQLFSIETNWKFWCFCFFYSFIGKTNKNSDFLHVVKVRYSRKNICILNFPTLGLWSQQTLNTPQFQDLFFRIFFGTFFGQWEKCIVSSEKSDL